MATLRVLRPNLVSLPLRATPKSTPSPSLRSSLRTNPSHSHTHTRIPRRTYATEPTPTPSPSSPPPPHPPKQPASLGNGALVALIGGTAAAIGGWYYLNTSRGKDPFKDAKSVGAKIAGAASAGGAGGKTAGGAEGGKVDYQKVYNAVAHALEEGAEDYDDGSYGPVLVRLAWHASGTYDKSTGNGGSNGATMRFAPESNHGANAGLIHAREKLDPIKKAYPAITYSDLWTLAGVAAVQEMGGPKIPWRPGRQDGMAENCTPDGRLPDGDKGSDHLRHIFYRMGFDDQEIVALSGAHALGRCHRDRSGFDGPWSFSPISFSNEYFRLLYESKWVKRQWEGPIQFQDKDTKSLMMLTTDMALTTDKAFKKYSSLYAKDEKAFFADFSKAFAKLLELGVPEKNWTVKEPILFKTTTEQSA